LFATRFWENLSPQEQETFADVIYLLPKTAMVDQANLQNLQRLGKPVAIIKAEHPVHKSNLPKAKKAKADDAEGMELQIKLAVGAKVMIRKNLWTSKGLVNGAQGLVKAIWYTPNSNPRNGDLPAVIFVSCPEYSGMSFHCANECANALQRPTNTWMAWSGPKLDSSNTSHSEMGEQWCHSGQNPISNNSSMGYNRSQKPRGHLAQGKH
jgi:ribosomal protein L24